MEKNQINKPQIDIAQTTSINSEDGKPMIFNEGIIFRKISRFLVGSEKDQLIPLSIMYDTNTGKILLDTIPKEIRDEYKDFGFSL